MKIWSDVLSQFWLLKLPAALLNYFRERHSLKRILENSVWLFIDRAVRLGVGLFIWIWLARYLGSEQFGLYNYALAFVSLFGALATLGLDSIVVRDIAHDSAVKEELLGTAFILKLLGGVLVLAITYAVIIHLRPEDSLVHWLVAISASGLIFQAFDTIDFWFQAQIASRYTVYAKNAAFILAALVKVALIMYGATLVAFAWAGLMEAIFGAALMVVVYRYNNQSVLAWRFNLFRAKSLLSNSWPLIFSSTFVFINMLVDKIMIGEIAGDVEVGLYSAASRISEIWYLIPVIIGASAAPALMREKARNERGYYSKLQKIYNFMSVTSLAVALPVMLLSDHIISAIYGENYQPAGAMLSIHIWSALFVFHVSIRSRSLVIEGKSRFIALYAFLGMMSNVLMNIILIPEYGGVGASYASLVSWVLCALVFPWFSATTKESVAMFLRSLNIIRYANR